VLVSDHGNLEAAEHTSHTRNPVPMLAIGPAADAFAGLERIDRVTPRLLRLLGVEG
jgi:phosphopentomutase